MKYILLRALLLILSLAVIWKYSCYQVSIAVLFVAIITYTESKNYTELSFIKILEVCSRLHFYVKNERMKFKDLDV